MATIIPLSKFQDELSSYIELSSVALGGKVTSVSDEFFAKAANLIEVEPAPSMKGQFGPNGALYSGWESRRHNPNFDWCIIQLGAPGYIHAFDIDTSHFNGNEAPEASVEACLSNGSDIPTAYSDRWIEILPKSALGPNARHLFRLPSTYTGAKFNYVKLNIFPDGGIARFRVYGLVAATIPREPSQLLDLAHVFSGGHVVFTSDQHFGVGSNLILPGRGKDMRDGWETKRSREKGHKDWVIIRLGHPGILESVEIDTNHFKGNYPESCELHACNSNEVNPNVTADQWIQIIRRQALGPHKQHFLPLENVAHNGFTHVRVTIYPDGGIKRVRLMGRCGAVQDVECGNSGITNGKASDMSVERCVSPKEFSVKLDKSAERRISAFPLTAEAFMPFGQVLMAWKDSRSAPKGVEITSANQGTAQKFHNLAGIESSYPSYKKACTRFSVYRSSSPGAQAGGEWAVKILERHPHTNQAFIPMGSSGGTREDELQDTGKAYLVIVALNGDDDLPDLPSLRAFIATASQGIVYNTGIWHHPVLTLDAAMDFTCVETQIGNGDKLDCEIVDLAECPVVCIPDIE